MRVLLTVLLMSHILVVDCSHGNFIYTAPVIETEGPVLKKSPAKVGGLSKTEFVEEAIRLSKIVEKEYGVPALATVSMAIYESNYGRSSLARNHNNFFGLKSARGGVRHKAKDGWSNYRTFKSMEDGFRGYGEFLQKKRYKKAFGKTNLEFVKSILSSGYCPDSFYLSDIKKIVKRHDLDKI